MKRSMKKITIAIMIITVLSKILGFGRELVLSYLFGISNISDIYLISITIPNVIFGFVVAGISAGYIPVTSRINAEEDNDSVNIFTNNLINILLMVCTVVYIASLIFTKQIVNVFASGFSDENLRLAIQFTRVSILAIFPITLIAVFTGYLHNRKKYLVPALIGIPLNLIIFISLYLSKIYTLNLLPIGFLVASMSQVLFMLPFLFKNGYRYTFKINFRDKYIGNMLKMTFPVIIGISANQINLLIDRSLASTIMTGGISVLNYSSKLVDFVHSILIMSIVTVLYPIISDHAANKRIDSLKKAVNDSIVAIMALLVPTMVVLLVLSDNIITFLFGRGAFDQNAIRLTSSVFMIYVIGLIGFGFRELFSKIFYSLQNTMIPMLNGLLGVAINIVLNFILSRFWGINGLAIATTLSAIITTILLSISLHKQIGRFITHESISKIFKIIGIALFTGGTAKISFLFCVSFLSQNIALIMAILLAYAMYFLLIMTFNIYRIDKKYQKYIIDKIRNTRN